MPNARERLQMLIEQNPMRVQRVNDHVTSSGPPYDTTWTHRIVIKFDNEETDFTGQGPSKGLAKEDASAKAVDALEWWLA
ncbi:hypothetical protein PIIN_10074 [Serendipita indica DSM 11827]|uniref:DRBM domain-containing protein n=1 Tax=Serendipita indica (strain DSM 11827) TaxID=1109443 RepID=G4TXN1_SERID|nr:hypothetical protein PIIN_10074 [Serendipita indica DSM 11827]